MYRVGIPHEWMPNFSGVRLELVPFCALPVSTSLGITDITEETEDIAMRIARQN